jgi:glycosyltransferase involved in cell wall biosynthesis
LPKVNTIVPNFNHARFLERRLRSIYDQTFHDYELILLDDASTDSSRDVLQRHANDAHVRIVLNEQNGGSPFRQWNKGVGLAEGEYVWIAESDDFADARFLERLVPLLDRHPRVGLAYCQCAVVNERDDIATSYIERLDSVHPALWHQDFVMEGREFLRRYQVIMNCIPNASGVVFRKSLFLATGGAVENMKLAGDWMTWSRMLLHADVAFVAETLNYYRVHERTARADWMTHQAFPLEYAAVIRFISAAVDVPPESRRKAIDRLRIRWRRVSRGVTAGGILRLCARVWAIGTPAEVLWFFAMGLAAWCRSRPMLRPFIRLGKAVLPGDEARSRGL